MTKQKMTKEEIENNLEEVRDRLTKMSMEATAGL